MGLKAIGLGLKKVLPELEKRGVSSVIRPANLPSKINPNELKLDTATFSKMTSSTSKVLKREDVIAKYCAENNLVANDILNIFNNTTKHLDEVSCERLLKLANEGKLELFVTSKRKRFIFNRLCEDKILLSKTKGVLNYLQEGDKETQAILKELLALEKQGKITPNNINEVLKLQSYEDFEYTEQCLGLVKKLRSGEITNSQIKEASFYVTNDIPLEVFNVKNLSKFSKFELNYFALMTQGVKCKDFSPEIFNAIRKELSALVKVNKVSPEVSNAFLKNFNQTVQVFEKETLSIEKLAQAGGINLQYTRNAFKNNILKEIEHLPITEQNRILAKFGLANEGNGIISGLPIANESTNLSKLESSINESIKKFLSTDNKVVLPQGFEELSPALDDICKAIPEFKFTIGAIQHKTQNYNLAEHMLKAMQENMKNPLYKELGNSDRRILGISTLLHDINKIEKTITTGHALPSSRTVNAIVERMPNLTPMEKDRIVNFVKNHHWLEKVSDNSNVIDELATAFRSGNDFKMAKIFAESDLKAVNDRFFTNYGYKINSPATQAIDDAILNLQSKGRMMFTANVNAHKAIENGAKTVKLGSGVETTNNLVIDSKQMGFDTNYFAYHGSNESALQTVIASCGYDKGLGLSISIGKNGASKVFENNKIFVIFDRLNMNTLGKVASRNANTKYGKSPDQILGYMKKDKGFVREFKTNYPHEISDKDYALVFREIQGLELNQVGSCKKVQQILGSETKAKDFENALRKTNSNFVSSATAHSETVAFDLRAGAIGTKGKASELSYDFRKFLEENNIPIVENII